MKKAIILIFALFLFNMILINAFVSDQDYNRSNLEVWCDEGLRDNSTSSVAPTIGGTPANSRARPPWGNASCFFDNIADAADYATYTKDNIKSQIYNFSILFITNVSTGCGGFQYLAAKGTDDGSQAQAWGIFYRATGTIEMDFYGSPTPAVETGGVTLEGGKHFNQVVYAVNKTGTTCTIRTYINQTEVNVASGTCSSTAETSDTMSIGAQIGGTSALCGAIDEFSVFNFTLTSNNVTRYWNNGNFERNEPSNITVPAPDISPPSITYYNLTSSDNGCENWNTNKSNPCSTSFVTPTIQFNTSENAWCALTGNSSETLGKNYTEMEASRNCTGDASGEGTKEHFCTLNNTDELVYETSYIYISCKDSSNNQNRTGVSTSGALKLSITSLESNAKSSIGIGIQNALLSSYTNYTDLQIYARNLSNAQVKGTFDRAAKKGIKMWAFNRIGASDSHVNMFNLTPVLYTLEFANITSTNLTNQTQRLIEATK